MERRAVREATAIGVVLLRLVGDDHDALRAFAVDLARDREHRQRAVHRLAAGHRHRVVEEDLVRDVGVRRDRLAHREVARVVVRAVAQVLEDVRRRREHRVRHPVDAFAAHLDQAGGGPLGHPRRHEVAADAGLRVRALRHLRRRVVRAARAEVRHPPHRIAVVGEQRRRDEVDDARSPVEPRPVAREPVGHHRHHARRAQLADRRQQRRARDVGLADDDRPRARVVVVEELLHLRLHHRRLLLDDEDLLQPLRERAHSPALDGERQADLVDAHAGVLQVVRRQVEPPQRLQQVEVRLAARDDADVGARRRDHGSVDAGVRRERAHGRELVHEPRLDDEAGQVGPAVVQAAGRRRVIGRRVERRRHAVEVDGGAALDRLRDRLQAHPRAGEARQRPAVEAELDHLRDVGRVQHRHAPRLHREVALVRHRRRHAAVVVAGHDEHAAARRRAVRVAVLQRVAGAVDAGSLAVPEGEDAVDGALGIRLDLLRAEHGRGRQLLVDRGQETHARLVDEAARLPELLVHRAQWRPAVAADVAGRGPAARRIQGALRQRQAHQRLRPRKEDLPARRGQRVAELVVEAQVFDRGLDGRALGLGGGDGRIVRRHGCAGVRSDRGRMVRQSPGRFNRAAARAGALGASSRDRAGFVTALSGFSIKLPRSRERGRGGAAHDAPTAGPP